MKRTSIGMILFAMVSCAVDRASAGQLLYLASTKGKTIVAYEVDSATGKLTKRFAVDLPGNAGPLAFSPDATFVYAAMTGLEDGKAGVATFKRTADGSLTLLTTAHITSRAPYIRVDKSGTTLLAAHYGDGDVTTYRIKDGICTDELLDHQITEKTAHCIELDPTGEFAFVPHTSPNKVYQFRLNSTTGKLTPNDPPFVPGPDTGHRYHEPRHYAHHPKLDLAYTSNENGGGITAWKFDPASGTLRELQTLCTLPPDYSGESAAADIKITADARFAFVSNRDITKRKPGDATQDTLAAVALDPKSGSMKVIGHYPTAHHPRSFCIDLTGNFIFAAGRRAATLVAYRINQKTGELNKLAEYQTDEIPIWVMCGSVE